MMPKLFLVYNPQLKGTYREDYFEPNRSGPVSTIQNEEAAQIQMAEGLLYQMEVENSEVPESNNFSIEKIECFLFKMLYGLYSEKLVATGSQGTPSQFERGCITPSKAARKYWDNIRNEIAGHRLVPLSSSSLAKVVYENRNLILRDLEKILRVILRIETRVYQRQIQLKEVIFENVQQTGSKAQKFFMILADSLKLNSQLMDVLCISPDDLNTICKPI